LNKLNGFNIVLTKGTFDILHAGHISLLAYCTRLKVSLSNGILVVIVESSESVKIRKGSERPFQNEYKRALQLALMPNVDAVIVANYVELGNLIETIKPNYYVKGMDTAFSEPSKSYSSELIIDSEINPKVRCINEDGTVVIFTDDGALSTSSLIKKIREK
jgi:bifunctional ADP-heptose synthase (sugar kinase/adenylyltransferase)